jgi:AcrR family transcriptional regulator
MPRIKPERKAERRAEIVAAARRCFARHGFHRTTLQDVFAESGLSAGCVYNYFKSKDELIRAIADERHATERQVLRSGAASENPAAGLRSVVARFVDDYLRPRSAEKRLIALQTWAEATRDTEILAVVRTGLGGPRREIEALIRRGKAAKVFARDVEPDATARTIIALFHGFLLQRLWDPKLDLDACGEVFERFLRSLEP